MLELKNTTKSFGKNILFKDLSFVFPEKGCVGITGKSGAGKTTLLRIIAGLDKVSHGEVIGGGIGKVSFSFQEYRLFPTINVLENLLVSFKVKNEDTVKKARELMTYLGFFEDDLLKKPSELSGGMKQRTSLARALLKESEILILDEPTKELDEALITKVHDLIKKEKNDRLVIITSHNIEEIYMLSDQILEL